MTYPDLIPEPTLRRLPLYYQYLVDLAEKGTLHVSSANIGQKLGFDATQVRKDLSLTGIGGKPKVGYGISSLILEIGQFLGWNNVNSAFLVGVGHLGSALLGYPQFSQHGLDIVAGFDTHPQKIGTEIHGKKILPLEKLPNLARRMGIQIGIITVPAHGAQWVADLMVQGGMKALWNFTPTALTVPPRIIVRNEALYFSLASISHSLATAIENPVDLSGNGDSQPPGLDGETRSKKFTFTGELP